MHSYLPAALTTRYYLLGTNTRVVPTCTHSSMKSDIMPAKTESIFMPGASIYLPLLVVLPAAQILFSNLNSHFCSSQLEKMPSEQRSKAGWLRCMHARMILASSA